MKIIELMGTITVPINNEESDLLENFQDVDILIKNELTEREQLLANQLVNKGILVRKNNHGKIQYSRQKTS